MTNADAVFDRFVASMGDPEAIAQVQSITGIADCISHNGPYITELYSVRGDKLFFQQVRPERPTFTAVINGSLAWTIDHETQQPRQIDARSAAMVQSHDFLMLPLVLRERFTNPTFSGTTTFAKRLCYKIEATDIVGAPSELYFDVETGYWRSWILSNPVGAAGETVEVTFVKWQPVGEAALTLPLEILITDKAGDYHFTFREVTFNTVNENIFDLPPELRQA